MNLSELDFGLSSLSPDVMLMLRIGAAVLLVALWWRITARISARHSRERLELIELVENLRRENRSVVEIAQRNGRRLKELEQQLGQVSTRVEASGSSSQLSELPNSYEQAIRLVRRGADVERLVSDIGLSRGEAELVVRLHGDRKVS